MKLLNSQEIAVERARKRHEFEQLYNELDEQLKKQVAEFTKTHMAMLRLQKELFDYLQNL